MMGPESLYVYLTALVFAFGACVGSFLNVCIYRIPHDQSVVRPPSHCFACGERIAWYDNIPVLAWFVLRGRCRNCRASISPRYFAVEALNGSLWVLAAWCFLTIGITLGSYWAYYELGWGGWWFWDPVENASFMPWLVGTALLHSALVVERRQALVNWTILLGILAFSLSLVGTFLVRSGVLTSVHAFAQDPARGVFVLVLLALARDGARIA